MEEATRFELFVWWLLLSWATAGVSSAVASARVSYNRRCKPSWAPPAWLFGVVWPVLYTLIAWAAWRIRLLGVWVSGVNLTELVLALVLLFVLMLWNLVYNGIGSIVGGAVVVFASLGVAVATTVLFWAKDTLAGALLLPLDAWLAFALALNIAIAVCTERAKSENWGRAQQLSGQPWAAPSVPVRSSAPSTAWSTTQRSTPHSVHQPVQPYSAKNTPYFRNNF